MNKRDVVLAWKKDHAPRPAMPTTAITILPGYRLDFGEKEQLKLNFEGIDVREYNPEMAIIMYRRFR